MKIFMWFKLICLLRKLIGNAIRVFREVVLVKDVNLIFRVMR